VLICLGLGAIYVADGRAKLAVLFLALGLINFLVFFRPKRHAGKRH
jgi:hypothetical protein